MRRYTLEDVIEILGISRKTYYNWENSKKIPKAKRDPMSKFRIFDDADIKRLRKITNR
jgi:DNA-binding transcriptional MerR regulator